MYASCVASVWRPNAGAQPRLEAEAQRTLEGGGGSALFGSDYASELE